MAALLFGGSALLFWPTDLWAFADNPEAIRNFAVSRPLNVLACALAVVLMPRLRERPAAAAMGATALGAVVAAIIGASRARLGGLGDIWFTYSFFTPFASLIVVAPLASRALGGLAVAAAYPLAYFGTRPEHLEHPNLASATVFLTFVTLCVVALGHAFFRLLREEYHQRAHLEERVRERTLTLSRLTGRLHAVLEDERRRVAHDLHDETGALLTALRMEVGALNHSLPGIDARTALLRIDGIAKSTLDAHRRVIQKLRPRALDEVGLSAGLVALIEPLMERHPGLHYEPDDLGTLSDEVTIAAFRIVQEATTNALRHADAKRVKVAVHRDPSGVLIVTVDDDGQGFAAARRPGGLGLVGMEERARGVGGTLEIDSALGRGTRVVARIPVGD